MVSFSGRRHTLSRPAVRNAAASRRRATFAAIRQPTATHANRDKTRDDGSLGVKFALQNF